MYHPREHAGHPHRMAQADAMFGGRKAVDQEIQDYHSSPYGLHDAACLTCISCHRTLQTAIGRSQQERRKHLAEYHSARVMYNRHSKRLWTDE